MLVDDVRKVVKASGMSVYQLAARTEIPRGNLSQFLAGHRGLSFASLEALARELRLRLVKEEPA